LPFGATYTPGTPATAANLITGEANAELQITEGATGVSGGVVNPLAHLFGSGNNSPVAATAGLPTIIKPNSEIVARITNSSSGVNPGITFALAFAEIKIPEYIYGG